MNQSVLAVLVASMGSLITTLTLAYLILKYPVLSLAVFLAALVIALVS